ncbi:TetR family transcriptional regulator [Streptomyces sp. Ru73]|uniref:TetR/AcrR family transcriptional regulator n=1 Tax=Streptomyces sp. Ru73 TaxID=2080748 RepID=UPI000CDDAD73|nr:TetR/AcrR family transcriptional regulator [Streptomyces sp. Ru73]POX42750.1 TetR family transcriptional regulator [Streptomyces sp. Ru73]
MSGTEPTTGRGTAATGRGAAASGRPARADARRNRDKLLAAARDAFAASSDAVALDAIARAAGVGIGTLYRHFPTREALVEAVYATELDEVVASARPLLDELEPAAALRAWMTRYAEFFKVKRGMSDTLRAGWASGSIATPATRERITATVDMMLRSGAESGSLRGDVDPEDVTLMLLGAFLSTAAADSPEKVDRLLDLIVEALRPAPEPQGG